MMDSERMEYAGILGRRHYSSFPLFRFSNLPPFQFSIIPASLYSNFPIFQHSDLFCLLQVSDGVMAAQARELAAARCRVRCFNRIDNFSMTVTTGLLGDLPAMRFDLNVVFIAAGGEEKGMPESVRCLRRVLADKVCRGVAAIAGGNRAVRRLEPTVEFFAHDMTVGASRRIVSKIGPTFGIGEGVDTNADSYADKNAKQDASNYARVHLCFRSTAVRPPFA